jgi:GT2 family glycosyltransferase
VIVTWNCRSYLGPCLESVWRSTQEHTFEVIVADNASSDGVTDYLRRAWPDVRVIETGGNLGFAVANNRAFATARGRHIVLLNPDTVVRAGALDRLVAHLDEHPGAGVVAPRLLNPDGTDQGTARRFPSPAVAVLGRRSPLTRLFPDNRWSRRYLVGRNHANDRPFEVDWVSGACLMVPRTVIDQVGGLDEGFFMHWEDADWCFRVKQAGRSVWCVPDAEVTHHEGGSRQGWPAAQVLHFHRGAYRFYAKHFAGGPRRPLRPLVRAALMTRAGLVIVSGRSGRSGRRGRSAAPVLAPTEVSKV